MDMQFFNNTDRVPQPKDRVKIEHLEVTPYPDRFRVFVEIHVTPFQERPNIILVARDGNGNNIGELTIIETMHFNMEFTMHIRHAAEPAGDYTLSAELFYESKNPPQDHETVLFSIPGAESA